MKKPERVSIYLGFFLIANLVGLQSVANAMERSESYLRTAREMYNSGKYFTAARYAFAASEEDPRLSGTAYSIITLGLVRSGLYHSASYFFIRTLQTGDETAKRRVLSQTQKLLDRVGPDLFRNFLLKHTELKDYSGENRGAFLYAVGKSRLLRGDREGAIRYLSAIGKESSLAPFAHQLKAVAYATGGEDQKALQAFEQCIDSAEEAMGQFESSDDALENHWRVKKSEEFEDLKTRCQAGVARTFYQMDRNVEADRAYDQISKNSFVWTDILFEHAWNSFGKKEYNRTLGKLVTYKNPDLQFVFNPEAEVLRAQSYLALCEYDDANKTINEFNRKYTRIGKEIKRFVEKNSNRMSVFYRAGKLAYQNRLHTQYKFYRLLNRFVRSPYFRNLIESERAVAAEKIAIKRFSSTLQGAPYREGEGFAGFLEEVLGWRANTLQFLGGAFVKNSLIDYHSRLISDFEKMSFIKLEMLSRAKDRLVFKSKKFDRERGNIEPDRRDDQYYWSFNGEFWNDELGDYVFGLESKCGSGS